MIQDAIPGINQEIKLVELRRKQILAELKRITQAAPDLDRSTQVQLAKYWRKQARLHPEMASTIYKAARAVRGR
jgi:hypothetical protein